MADENGLVEGWVVIEDQVQTEVEFYRPSFLLPVWGGGGGGGSSGKALIMDLSSSLDEEGLIRDTS
jgi:hypothetical protein